MRWLDVREGAPAAAEGIYLKGDVEGGVWGGKSDAVGHWPGRRGGRGGEVIRARVRRGRRRAVVEEAACGAAHT
jgi:hypothetical protein